MARILVIDDDEEVRLLIKHMLEGAGHSVSLAADGEDGFEQFRLATADLVLGDVFMPVHQAT
jgi:CheY-like chemotaxis protein